MIIESLHNHYCAEVAKGNPLYPPAGMELKRIHFVVVISSDGILVDIEERNGLMHVIRSRQRGGKDAPLKPNYMWDSLGYITGKPFAEMVREIYSKYPNNPTFKAVHNFYYRGIEQLESHPLWCKIASKSGHTLTFRLAGEVKIAAQQPELIKPINKGIALSHPKIYINGAAGTGAKLVSYGRNLGYESYGLKAGENASIPTDIAEGYATNPAVYGAIAARMCGVRSISVLIDEIISHSFTNLGIGLLIISSLMIIIIDTPQSYLI